MWFGAVDKGMIAAKELKFGLDLVVWRFRETEDREQERSPSQLVNVLPSNFTIFSQTSFKVHFATNFNFRFGPVLVTIQVPLQPSVPKVWPAINTKASSSPSPSKSPRANSFTK